MIMTYTIADSKILSVRTRHGKTSATCRSDLTRGIIQDHNNNAAKAMIATVRNAMIIGEFQEKTLVPAC
jgi:hypothetical protein